MKKESRFSRSEVLLRLGYRTDHLLVDYAESARDSDGCVCVLCKEVAHEDEAESKRHGVGKAMSLLALRLSI